MIFPVSVGTLTFLLALDSLPIDLRGKFFITESSLKAFSYPEANATRIEPSSIVCKAVIGSFSYIELFGLLIFEAV